MHVFSRPITRPITIITVLLAAIANALPIDDAIVDPAYPGTVIVNVDNTLNATTPAPPVSFDPTYPKSNRLPLKLVNNLRGGTVNAYLTGTDRAGHLVMLQPDSTFYYPSANKNTGGVPQIITGNIAIPMGEKGNMTYVDIPDYVVTTRLYFAEGELSFYTVPNPEEGAPALVQPALTPNDPNIATNWGFVEFGNTEKDGLFVNLSFVDFVGLSLGLSVKTADGQSQTPFGLNANAVAKICKDLEAQTAVDGYPWKDLCVYDDAGKPLRVLAPKNNPDMFGDYWNGYIDQVWSHYSTNTLNVDGMQCKVIGDAFTCDGTDFLFDKPSSADIFGCNSGPLANDGDGDRKNMAKRLCAGFDRGTLLMDEAEGVTSDKFYTSPIVNQYSKAVHKHLVDGMGYTFAYDDVPGTDGVSQAGMVASTSPQLLTVTVGGPGKHDDESEDND